MESFQLKNNKRKKITQFHELFIFLALFQAES